MFYHGKGYIIFGLRNIAKMLGVSKDTVRNWIKKHGFPAVKLPNNEYGTTKGLVDAWLMARINLKKKE